MPRGLTANPVASATLSSSTPWLQDNVTSGCHGAPSSPRTWGSRPAGHVRDRRWRPIPACAEAVPAHSAFRVRVITMNGRSGSVCSPMGFPPRESSFTLAAVRAAEMVSLYRRESAMRWALRYQRLVGEAKLMLLVPPTSYRAKLSAAGTSENPAARRIRSEGTPMTAPRSAHPMRAVLSGSIGSVRLSASGCSELDLRILTCGSTRERLRSSRQGGKV